MNVENGKDPIAVMKDIDDRIHLFKSDEGFKKYILEVGNNWKRLEWIDTKPIWHD